MAEIGDIVTILVNGVAIETEIDDHGTQRFKQNDVIRFLVDSGKIDLNQLYIAVLTEKLDDWAYFEFYMALGYSVCGFYEVFGPSSSWEDNGREPVEILNPVWETEEETVH